jgi:glycosyltransferase involved in cell wall biosynthesis
MSATEPAVAAAPAPSTKPRVVQGVSIVMPALNEAEAIGEQIAALQKVLGTLDVPSEVIVVDDGSTDGTGDLAEKAGARVVTNPINSGYGASLKRGIQASRYEHIVICDADGTYPVDRIPDLLKESERGFDMVVGARTGKYYRGSLLKHPWRLFYLELCRFVTGVKIPDANSGLRVFKKSLVLEFFDDLCLGYSFTTTLTLAMLSRGSFVKFMPIDYMKRIGKSKVRFFIDALRTAQLIVQTILLYNPIKLFLLIAFPPTVVALVLLALAIWYSSGALVIASTVAATAALITFSFGLIMDVVRKAVRRDPPTTR